MTIHKMINVPRNLSSQFTSQFQDRGSLFLGNNLESDLVPGPGNNNSQNYNCSQKFKFGINHPKIPRQGSLLFSIIFFCRVKQINHWRHSVVACKLYFSHLNQLWLLIVTTYSRRSDLQLQHQILSTMLPSFLWKKNSLLFEVPFCSSYQPPHQRHSTTTCNRSLQKTHLHLAFWFWW